MSGAVDLSVLIVTYRSEAFIARCLQAIPAAADGLAVQIVVADNHSPDGTLRVLAGMPGIDVVALPVNGGFAVGSNAALARANGRVIVFLNPDTEAGPSSLRQLVDVLDGRPEVGIAAPALIYPDGSEQRTARAFPRPAAGLFGRRSLLTRAFPNNRWSRSYLSPSSDEAPSGHPYEVDWVSGACLAMRREVALAAGGLDEGFFMHWEDADLCRRVKNTGRQVLCVPSARVVHDEGACRRGWPPDQVVAFHRGAYRYWVKHHARSRLSPLRAVAAVLLTFRAALLVLAALTRQPLSQRALPKERPLTFDRRPA